MEIGTFYYVWYDFDDRISWEYPKICDKPALGYYDSCDVGIVKQHFDWFSDLYLDFIIVSYWGHYNQTRWNQFVLNATHQIFKTAKEIGTNIKICVMVEPFNQTENPKYHYQEILNYVYDNFIAPYHALYYNYQGKPLICFFNDPYLTPNGNIPKDENFTVKIVGQESYAEWVYTDLIPIAGPIPRNGQIPVTPRFDDSRFRSPSNVVDKDLSEGVYDEQWKRAVDYVRNGTVNVITISSWNEYPERTAIEPHWDADAYDPNPYLLYDKTRRYIVELKGVDAELNLPKRAKELAHSYLTNSYNSTLGLCYEHPRLKNVSWIANDNVLASYVLQKWNRNLADNITKAIRRIANEYSLLMSQNGLPLNCRAEILLGYNVSVFFNKTELVTLDQNYYGSFLKTEKATNKVMTDFEDYADLLCYAFLD